MFRDGLRRRLCQRWLRAVFGVVAFGAALAIIMALVRSPSHDAYLAWGTLANLCQPLRMYDAEHGHLPPPTAIDATSEEPYSWRIEVYSFYVRSRLIDPRATTACAGIDYDRSKAWNDPANLQLQEFGAKLFRYTQADYDPQRRKGKAGEFATYYKAITGPGTAFDFATAASLKELPNDVILLVRVERSDTHWMEPGDLSVEQLTPSDETKELLRGRVGYVVLFADGEPWVLSRETPIADLCKFFTVAGARQFNREEILAAYRVLP